MQVWDSFGEGREINSLVGNQLKTAKKHKTYINNKQLTKQETLITKIIIRNKNCKFSTKNVSWFFFVSQNLCTYQILAQKLSDATGEVPKKPKNFLFATNLKVITSSGKNLPRMEFKSLHTFNKLLFLIIIESIINRKLRSQQKERAQREFNNFFIDSLDKLVVKDKKTCTVNKKTSCNLFTSTREFKILIQERSETYIEFILDKRRNHRWKLAIAAIKFIMSNRRNSRDHTLSPSPDSKHFKTQTRGNSRSNLTFSFLLEKKTEIKFLNHILGNSMESSVSMEFQDGAVGGWETEPQQSNPVITVNDCGLLEEQRPIVQTSTLQAVNDQGKGAVKKQKNLDERAEVFRMREIEMARQQASIAQREQALKENEMRVNREQEALLRAQQNGFQGSHVQQQVDQPDDNEVQVPTNVEGRFILRTRGETEFSIRPRNYPRDVITSRNAAMIEGGVATVLERTNMNINLTTLKNKNGVIFVSAENAEASERVALYIENVNWLRLNLTPMICVSSADSHIYPTIEIQTTNQTVTFEELCIIIEGQNIANTTYWRLVNTSIRKQVQAIFIAVVDFASMRELCGYGYKRRSFAFGANNSYASIILKQSQLDEFNRRINGKEITMKIRNLKLNLFFLFKEIHQMKLKFESKSTSMKYKEQQMPSSMNSIVSKKTHKNDTTTYKSHAKTCSQGINIEEITDKKSCRHEHGKEKILITINYILNKETFLFSFSTEITQEDKYIERLHKMRSPTRAELNIKNTQIVSNEHKMIKIICKKELKKHETKFNINLRICKNAIRSKEIPSGNKRKELKQKRFSFIRHKTIRENLRKCTNVQTELEKKVFKKTKKEDKRNITANHFTKSTSDKIFLIIDGTKVGKEIASRNSARGEIRHLLRERERREEIGSWISDKRKKRHLASELKIQTKLAKTEIEHKDKIDDATKGEQKIQFKKYTTVGNTQINTFKEIATIKANLQFIHYKTAETKISKTKKEDEKAINSGKIIDKVKSKTLTHHRKIINYTINQNGNVKITHQHKIACVCKLSRATIIKNISDIHILSEIHFKNKTEKLI